MLHLPRNFMVTKETFIRPWQYAGTIIFHYGENDYLIIADYYSKFPVIRKMSVYATSTVVIKTSKKFSE